MRQEYWLISFIVIIIIAIVSLFLMFFLDSNKPLTGQVIDEYEHSLTKALCNATHCQDYEIKCKGKILVSKNPLNGAVIEKPENWIDPRSEMDQNRLCD